MADHFATDFLSSSDNSRLEALAKRMPDGFLLGTATSSWQIEGASESRGRSIWDDFSAIPGKIIDGAIQDPACDHVNRLETDLDLLSWLGVEAYRFSISWPRVIPQGTGEISEVGLSFYDRLIDGLLERGIKPAVTLYHWDLPSALGAKGGWNWSGIGDAFAEYTDVLAQRFSDRMFMWATLNEPWCSAFLGYADTVMAPGKGDAASGFEAAYRLLVAHGRSVEVLRDYGCKNVGIVLNPTTFIAEDEAAKPAAQHMDGIMNRLWLDPLAGRGFPSDVIERTKSITDWSFVEEKDLQLITQPIDWLGVNFYMPTRVSSTPPVGAPAQSVGARPDAFPGCPPIFFVPRGPLTKMGWEVHPESMTTTLLTTTERLPGVPIYITENGGAFPDLDIQEGVILDHDRVDYFDSHINAALDARDKGVDLRGYFAWSFLDNLEWAEGWTKRFGIVHVEPTTQKRTAKLSAYFFKKLLSLRHG